MEEIKIIDEKDLKCEESQSIVPEKPESRELWLASEFTDEFWANMITEGHSLKMDGPDHSKEVKWTPK